MSDPCILCVAITGSLPTKANNPRRPHHHFRAGGIHPRGLRGRRQHRSCPCSRRRGQTHLRSRAVRAPHGGHPRPLPRHDRAAFDRRPLGRGQGSRRNAAAVARHGKPCGRVEQLSDTGLRERARSGGLAGLGNGDAWRHARDRGFRSQPYPAGPCDVEGRAAEVARPMCSS